MATSNEADEREGARLILLGVSPEQALKRFLYHVRDESSEILGFLLHQSKFDLGGSGARADRLAPLLERWAELRQKHAMEQRVLETRIKIVSAVLGAVMAFFSALLPFVSSFNLLDYKPQASSMLPLFSFDLAVISSTYLASSLNKRNIVLIPILTSVVYAVVYYLVAPLSGISVSLP
jgi:hypothetical protein